MEMTNNMPLYWYVFYNDQLLLQKKADGYAIPFTNEAPVTVVRSLPVEMQDGTAAMADGLVERTLREAHLPPDTPVVATGGLAGLILPFCRRRMFCIKG